MQLASSLILPKDLNVPFADDDPQRFWVERRSLKIVFAMASRGFQVFPGMMTDLLRAIVKKKIGSDVFNQAVCDIDSGSFKSNCSTSFSAQTSESLEVEPALSERRMEDDSVDPVIELPCTSKNEGLGTFIESVTHP